MRTDSPVRLVTKTSGPCWSWMTPRNIVGTFSRPFSSIRAGELPRSPLDSTVLQKNPLGYYAPPVALSTQIDDRSRVTLNFRCVFGGFWDLTDIESIRIVTLTNSDWGR